MRAYSFLLIVLIILLAPDHGRSQGNPFELTDRLSEQTTVAPGTETAEPANPYDLRSRAADAGPSRGTVARPPIIVQPTDPDEGKGSIIAIHLILLLTMASLWILFRDLLSECLAGTVNDSIMTQLYRRRSGGQLGALWQCYFFFYLATGFYIYLFALHHGLGLRVGIWGSWLTFALVVAAAVGIKHFALWFLGRLFPLRKELSRYSFVLMVFSILVGLLLVPINLLVSYAPEEWREFFLYGGLLLLVGIYLLHLLRGLFIVNRFALVRPVQFLLYICVIEVAPLLLIYRYLSDNLPTHGG